MPSVPPLIARILVLPLVCGLAHIVFLNSSDSDSARWSLDYYHAPELAINSVHNAFLGKTGKVDGTGRVNSVKVKTSQAHSLNAKLGDRIVHQELSVPRHATIGW